MIESGTQKQLQELREENKLFKQNILSIQGHLKETIDASLKPLQDILKSKEAH